MTSMKLLDTLLETLEQQEEKNVDIQETIKNVRKDLFSILKEAYEEIPMTITEKNVKAVAKNYLDKIDDLNRILMKSLNLCIRNRDAEQAKQLRDNIKELMQAKKDLRKLKQERVNYLFRIRKQNKIRPEQNSRFEVNI